MKRRHLGALILMNRTLEFYKGKRVLITGSTGFKGSWLSFFLTHLGANIQGYALKAEGDRSLFNLLKLDDHIQQTYGDIRDSESLQKIFKIFQPEIVFHLAAQSLVKTSYEEPVRTFETNVIGSVNLLEAIRKNDCVKSLVYITSDKCYLNKEWLWGYRENDELGGPDPYSSSKACAEHVFFSYYQSYFKHTPSFRCASTRAGNVIGGGDRSANRIIPDIINALENKNSIFIRNPHATRPWQYVLDLIMGYLVLGKKLHELPINLNGQAWNFGPREESVQNVAILTRMVVDAWGGGDIEIMPIDPNHHEASLLHLNIQKSHQYLEWLPKLAFTEVVQQTTEWYKNISLGICPFKQTMKTLENYLTRL